jgi:hypothetical protein
LITSTLADEVVVSNGGASAWIWRFSAPGPAREFSTERAPGVPVTPGRTVARSAQVSSPAPPQARFDTRPEGSAGTKGVDGESPLPATDGPLTWVSALAQAASAGAGGTGIVAILLALVLTPSFLRRGREEAVVRRPASVSAPIDVPV